ncbi:MAG: alpha/beta hydrolase [Chloroflexota bacterium]|nr:alpha/beta hydrolase [Chloroflexota bacterium]
MPSLTINDIELWFEREGHGRPVIFLHAFAITGKMWFPQALALTAAGYDVVCVDQRGHGRSSSPPGPYTIPQMAEDIHRFITSLNLKEVCVVGLSMGGRVALRLALDYPRDVAALVLVSAKSEPAREIQFELEALATRAEQGEVDRAVSEWYEERYQRLAGCAPELTRCLIEEWRTKPGNGFAGAARAIIEMEEMTTRVSEISVPVLAVAGALDSPCLPFVAWYERAIPDCRGTIVAEAAHFVNVEQPDRFNDLLLTFLADHAGCGVRASSIQTSTTFHALSG